MKPIDVFTLFLFNVVVYNVPLLYGTTGEILVEKSGSLNLGVEGTMAVGAVFGYLLGCQFNSLFMGILFSFIFGSICGAIFSLLTVTFKANQNVTGLTLTTFGVALFFFVGRSLTAVGKWPLMRNFLNVDSGFKTAIEIPILSKIPILGKVLFSHNILVYLGVIIAVICEIYLKKSKLGLKLRAVGENPAAADSLGIKVTLLQYINIMVGSGIMGIGGYYMGLNLGGNFEGSTSWVNGYGWIAVALVIFANWSPGKAVIGTVLFGLFNTLQVYSTSIAFAFPKFFGWLSKVPIQLFQGLPFVITATVLILSSASKRPNAQPAHLGINYFREDR